MSAPTPPASVQVLTNSTLFANITDYIDGVSNFVLQFKATASKLQNIRSSTYRDYDRLWQMAVLCRNKRVLAALKRLAKTLRYKSSPHVQFNGTVNFALAVDETDVSFLDWLDDTFSDPAQRQIEAITFKLLALRRDKDLVVVQWLHSRGYEIPASMMDAAPDTDNLPLVRFLHEHGSNGCTTKAMDNAARIGRLDIVQFLHENRSDGCTQAAQSNALQYGHLDVFMYLRKHRSEGYVDYAVTEAATRGHLNCIQYAHEHNFAGFTIWTMSDAVAAGRLNVVQYLHEHRTEGCILEALLAAEKRGHRDVVDFLVRHRPVANPSAVMKEATRRRHLRLTAKLARQTMMRSPPAQVFEHAVDVQHPRTGFLY